MDCDLLRSARKKRWAFALALSSWLVTGTAFAASRYVFVTFKGDAAADEKLSVYTSQNGLDFTLLSNTGYAGPTGVLRDPSITKHSDGKYYIAYTLQSWTTNSASFAIASSPDLKNWTFQAEIPAQVSGVKDTWAPEWFKDTDGSVHLIVNIDTLGNDSDFRSYLFTATDDTLTKWSAPKLLGIGPNYIDTFVVKVGAQYHAFTKNETSKFIEHATAATLTGPWTFVGTGNWAGWGSGKEGPGLFQLENGRWRVFMDCYGGCGFLQATSTDLTTWSATSVVPGGLSGVVRHGTVLREDTGGAGGMTGGSGGTSGATGGAGRGANGGNAQGGAAGRASAGGAGLPSSAGTANVAGASTAGASAAGAAAAGAAAAGAASSGSAGAPPATPSAGSSGSGASPDSSDGCSCAVPNSRSTPSGSLPVGLALGALLLRRRARRRE
ncbi:MAG: glycoside hydrolase family 43 protein [Polyangiaceae bacterium]